MSKEQKGMIIGMYFAQFEYLAMQELGFKNFTEAFNVISLVTNIKATSLRNYRDEFTPAFPTKRLGWHKRKMHPSRKKILEKYLNLDFANFTDLIKTIIYKNSDEKVVKELELEIEKISFAKRLITGEAAENFFINNYQNIDLFKNGELIDTTKYGCGFDFKINFPNKYFAVEVKGLEARNGNISMTSKEFKVAERLKENYFIFIVKNFIKEPEYIYFQNPVFLDALSIKEQVVQIIQTSYNFYV